MKMTKKVYLLISSLLVVVMFGCGLQTAHAEEAGGAVQTNGEIGFYQNKAPQPQESSSSEVPSVNKPAGNLPSTGELVKKSLSISGLLLVVIVLGIFLFKRKKNGEEGGAES